MSLRGKSSFLLLIILITSVFFLVPIMLKSSWPELVDTWLDDYAEAVELAQNDDDDDEEDEHVLGNHMVQIDDEISAYAGIKTLALSSIQFTPETKVVAKVVDIHPLLLLRAHYNQAVATLNVAKVTEKSASQELARLQSLAKGAGSVAMKKVTYAQVLLKQEKAKVQALKVDVQAIRDEALQTWGSTVSGWVLTKDAKEWQRLLSHQDSLLLVALPTDLSLSANTSFIRVARNGNRDHARKAYYVSSALVTDQLIQGETYFFKTATGKLRTGMRLDAWVPQSSETLAAVFIPHQAMVWDAGQPWVYIQVEEDLYQRRALTSGVATAGGLFFVEGFEVGEELVILGAQMLLSEEFRWQILDEDDDD